ncbi:MAG TPA: thioredoxin domain-containing protein [Thermoanaerobaculia bacterium]|nr:thioredoxin domain-containing protein [Thermoanaerobaculia bacterium]
MKRSAGAPRSRDRRRRAVVAPALLLALALGAAALPANAADVKRQAPAAAAAAKVLNASAFSFERTVLHSDVPVVVAFWAPWCIVCRDLEAPLAELAAKLGGRARVVRVNVDWSSRVARRYDVQSLPTVLVFAGGELVSRSIGGATEEDLEELLASRLAPAAPSVVAVAPVAARSGL